jgi:serine/threonine protein kinase
VGTPYLVVRKLGQGGMGEVYEAEHVDLGRYAALKVLHASHHDRPDLAARLRAEARILARLSHPNLVEVFDLGVIADGRPWFAMQRLHGRDLREEIARAGALPPERAIGLIAQALDGLAAAHAAGLVHRDVKLENLFLEESGTLKVLDFGIAKPASASLTDPGGSPGTPRTMAPEQCAGAPVDARADLYAVGLALYELVVGHGPFDDLRGNDHAFRFAHCDRRPIAPSRVATQPLPPGLDAVILRALAKSPADRFPTAAAMAAALRRLLPRARSARRRARRFGNPWIAATVSALAVACFALGLCFGRALPPPERLIPAPTLR